VESFTGQLTVGRGLPGGKSLFLFAQEKEPKEGHPDITALRVPESRTCRVGGEEPAPLLLDGFR